MKKQNKLMEFLSSRGFYTAFFTCLFGVLAIAAFVSIRNIDAIAKLTESSAKTAADPTYGEKDALPLEDELAAVDIQQTATLQELAEKEKKEKEEKQQEEAQSRIKVEETKPKEEAAPKEEATTEAELNESKEAKTEVKEAPAAPKEQPKAEAKEEPKPEVKPQEKNEVSLDEDEGLEELVGITPLAEDAKLSWPLDGAVVMDFSTKHAIYDKTLDQYRTNPAICISSDIGTQVKAAADGIVRSITIEPRGGHTVTIDHGNGWITKYSQLQETVLVKEGQKVTSGQAIGGVGNPTKYGVLLGSHLQFQIDKDSVPQSPHMVLAK